MNTDETKPAAPAYVSLTVQEYAKLERLHPITVYRLIKRGQIPVVRHGRAIRIRVRAR